MASTYSPNLRLELIGTGEQQGTWGNTTNTNLGTLLEEAIGGYVSVTVSDVGDTTLTENNGAADQSRNMTLNLTGALTGARNVICPAIEKIYVVKNATTGGYAVTVKVSGQTGVSIPNGSTYFLYVDGTDVRMITGSLANQLANSVSITGGTITGITDLAVADGGTGVSTITGIIKGNGTSAFSAAVAGTDYLSPSSVGTIASQNSNNVSITGGLITGITDLAIADGGTGASTAAGAATNLGLGTGDSPQFTAVNIGNATDTTITRSSAGVIAVEGGIVPLENRTNTFSANQIIEVTDNTNAALRVTQLGTGNAILVEDSANPDSTPFAVDASGVVIIGSTTPESISSSFFQLIGDNAAANAHFLRCQTSANASGNLFFGRSNGTKASKTIVADNDRLGAINFNGFDGSAFVSSAQIRAEVDGTPGTNDMPGRLVFATSPDGLATPAERMRIRSDGNIGIGGTGSATTSLSIQKAITGGISVVGADVAATVQSDVTTQGIGYSTTLGTQAATFTTTIQHYRATQGTFGASSTVSAQYGFNSSASLIGATQNYAFIAGNTAAVTAGKEAYGFYSGINTATGGGTTWGFYAAGTASNYFAGQVQLAAGSTGTPSLSAFGDTNTGMWYPAADTIAWSTGGSERMRIRSDGNIGIGGVGDASVSFYIARSITGGTTATGVAFAGNVLSDVTTQALAFNTNIGTQAATFTTNIQHYRAGQGTFGAGSTVSAQYGFNGTGSLIGATANFSFFASDTAAVTTGKISYGFYSAINTATGGGTTYGFYADGTAQNLFRGDVNIFGAGKLGYSSGSGGAVTQGTSRTTGVTLDKTNGAITLFSAAGTTTWQSFTVTNSTVAATDTIIVCQKSGTDLYELHVTAVSAGSFRISFRTTGGTTTEQPVFNFAVIKAVTA